MVNSFGSGFGGFGSFPWSPGAAQNTVHEVILQGLLSAQGSAVAQDESSVAYLECYAKARVLADLWGTVARLSNQFSSGTMSDFLPRWENIYGIVPPPGTSLDQRRAVIGQKIALFGSNPNMQVVSDLLSVALGNVFVKILYGSDFIQDGSIYDGYAGIIGSVPTTDGYGTPVPGGFDFISTVGDITASTPTSPKAFNQQNWNSTMAYLAILVQQPVSMPNNVFLGIVGQIDNLLEGILPAWTTWNWVQAGNGGMGGFILDTGNIDGQEFFEP